MAVFTFENTGGGGPFNVFRGEADVSGSPTYHEMSFSDYIVPPDGKYHLKVTGFAEPEEVPIKEEFRKKDGQTTKIETKLELEILSDRGKGKRWICNYITFSLGDRSNLFKVYAAGVLKGDAKSAPATRNYDDLIGAEFEAFVVTAEKRDDQGKPIRASLTWNTIKPVGSADAEYDPFADEADVA